MKHPPRLVIALVALAAVIVALIVWIPRLTAPRISSTLG